jgi:hypothetical protein
MRAIIWVATLSFACGKHPTASVSGTMDRAFCTKRTLPADISATTHLLGWGSGPAAVTADDSARAEISKVFSVTVRQQFESNQQAHMETSNGATLRSQSTTQQSHTQSTTESTLEGVEIASHWMDGTHHCALAVLNRDRAAARMKTAIDAAEQAIDGHLKAGSENPNRFTELQHLNTAIDRATDRDAQNQTLLILNRAHRVSPERARASLQARRRTLLTEAGVRVSGSTLPDSLTGGLNAQLHTHGLRVDPNGQLRVHAELSIKPNGPDDYGFHHVAARLNVTFSGETGGAVSTFNMDSQASSQKRQRAKSDAIERLVQQFNATENPFNTHLASLLQERIN